MIDYTKEKEKGITTKISLLVNTNGLIKKVNFFIVSVVFLILLFSRVSSLKANKNESKDFKTNKRNFQQIINKLNIEKSKRRNLQTFPSSFSTQSYSSTVELFINNKKIITDGTFKTFNAYIHITTSFFASGNPTLMTTIYDFQNNLFYLLAYSLEHGKILYSTSLVLCQTTFPYFSNDFMQLTDSLYFVITYTLSGLNCGVSGQVVEIDHAGGFSSAGSPNDVIVDSPISPFNANGDTDIDDLATVDSRVSRSISMTKLKHSSYSSLVFLIYEEM